MKQIQRYVLTGGACLIIGLAIGIGIPNTEHAKPSGGIAGTSQNSISTINLGHMRRACESKQDQACDKLNQVCKDIVSVGTLNLDKLGPTYENANIDDFNQACLNEQRQAAKRFLEQEIDNLRSAAGSNAPRHYRPDPALANGMKHAVEINEMLCKTRGINCEEAKLFRRQYQEAISGF